MKSRFFHHVPLLGLACVFLFQSERLWGQVVINEILYRAPNDLNKLEFIEIHNAGEQGEPLGGWSFSEGIEYSFPSDTVLNPGKFIVLCRDAERFEQVYKRKADDVFEKSLNNGGERITLIDANDHVVDSVKYNDKKPWPESADGESASLERISPFISGESPYNWAPSKLAPFADTFPAGSPGERNGNFSTTLPPIIESVEFGKEIRSSGTSVQIRAKVSGTPSTVEISYQAIEPGKTSEETIKNMVPTSKAIYTVELPGLSSHQILRFQVRATDSSGAVRTHPHNNALQPSHSIYFSDLMAESKLPVFHFFMVEPASYQRGEDYREQHRNGRRGFGFERFQQIDEDQRLRTETQNRLENPMKMQNVWGKLALEQQFSPSTIKALSEGFRRASSAFKKLQEELASTQDVNAFVDGLDRQIDDIHSELRNSSEKHISDDSKSLLNSLTTNLSEEKHTAIQSNTGFPYSHIQRRKKSLFQSTIQDEAGLQHMDALVRVHKEAFEKRRNILSETQNQERIDFRSLIAKLQPEMESLQTKTLKISNPDMVIAPPSPRRNTRPSRTRSFGGGRGRFDRPNTNTTVQGNAAFICSTPEGKTFFYDFVNITQRKSGYKVRLGKGRTWQGMNTINVLYESAQATVLNEHLAYQLYPLAGNAASQSGFARVRINNELAGYHLWFEQPNQNFLRRNNINDEGNLYKVIWMGTHRPSDLTPSDKMPERMDIVGRFEKKTHIHDGYEDIIALVESLESAQGNDQAMWQLIQSKFDVDQVIQYYARQHVHIALGRIL